MATIVIDAGHGGADPGAVFEGRQEKDDTLRLALAVGKILEENGQNVIYTRTTDVYQTPFQKATIGNEARADFLFPYIAIPVRLSGSIPVWKHWSMSEAASKKRWQKTSTGNWRKPVLKISVSKKDRDLSSFAGLKCRQYWWKQGLSTTEKTTGSLMKILRKSHRRSPTVFCKPSMHRKSNLMNTKKKQKHLIASSLVFLIWKKCQGTAGTAALFGIRCCDRTWRGWDLPGLQWIF